MALLRLVRREKVDVIHTHGYGACTWGRIAEWLTGVPVLVHERSSTLAAKFDGRNTIRTMEEMYERMVREAGGKGG